MQTYCVVALLFRAFNATCSTSFGSESWLTCAAHGSRSMASAASFAASSGVFSCSSAFSAPSAWRPLLLLHHRSGRLPAIRFFFGWRFFQRRWHRTRLNAIGDRSQSFQRSVIHRPRAVAAAGSLFLLWLLPARAATAGAPPAWLVVSGSGTVGACCGADCGCGGTGLASLLPLARRVQRTVVALLAQAAAYADGMPARSSVISTPMRRSGAYGNSLRPINSV